ncbi:tetratricopeptide repeat protein [Aliiglaciecola sp. 2_MG-2023]|uniref:tetratricopeptide repeat protein n=1 Tax=unclassified Aliiglaciecola TaxID=2593648 RepID=UPI0026E1E689|nr:MULTISPECIES: tetratricopeptide repeat protein [unclassified Aliiglaciecola]MDO6709197.1 tetratricopeptide repeat protein [Aliiglaciecola sp. 2_MG-2023]MDO6750345.1 tetratricopeptide repeat protein [Aliiglaciecola sp. 1_MG-2023]
MFFKVKIKQFKVCLLLMLHVVFSSASEATTNTPIPEDFKTASMICSDVKGMDYRRNDREANILRGKVEGAHFTEGVQRGLYGNTGALEGDLNYTLSKFPNHPKALLVTAQNQMRPGYSSQRKLRKDKSWPSKECYFKRALDLAPDDPQVHLVIAIFYHQYKNVKVAQRHYEKAIKINSQNPEAHYNYGLLLLTVGEIDKAKEHAKIAYGLGYPLQGLKNKLISANVWTAKNN